MKRFLSLTFGLALVAAVALASWPGVYPEELAGDQLDWSGETIRRQVAVENAWWGQPEPPTPWRTCRVTSTPDRLVLKYGAPWANVVAPWDADCQCYLLLNHLEDRIEFASFTVVEPDDGFNIVYRIGTLKSTGSYGPWFDFDTTRLAIVGEIVERPMKQNPSRRVIPNKG